MWTCSLTPGLKFQDKIKIADSGKPTHRYRLVTCVNEYYATFCLPVSSLNCWVILCDVVGLLTNSVPFETESRGDDEGSPSSSCMIGVSYVPSVLVLLECSEVLALSDDLSQKAKVLCLPCGCVCHFFILTLGTFANYASDGRKFTQLK